MRHTKKQDVLAFRVSAVEDGQRISALMAEDYPFQKEIIGSTFAKGLPVDDRLMGIFYHNPAFTGLMDGLFRLVADLDRSAMYHVPDIGLVLQHIGNTLTQS